MNKKILFGLIILAIVGLSLFVFQYIKNNSSVYQMTGQIVELEDNTVFVKGTIHFPDPQNNAPQSKTVQFIITDQTKFTKTVVFIEKKHFDNLDGISEPFTALTKEEVGSMGDLNNDIIITVWSKENPSTTDIATATEIGYQVIEYEK